MKHTPGPWFSQYDDNGFFEIGSESVSFRIAFTYGESETAEADARLIAAAPEMLEVIEAVIFEVKDSKKPFSCDSYLPPHIIDALIRVAIKAGGRQP